MASAFGRQARFDDCRTTVSLQDYRDSSARNLRPVACQDSSNQLNPRDDVLRQRREVSIREMKMFRVVPQHSAGPIRRQPWIEHRLAGRRALHAQCGCYRSRNVSQRHWRIRDLHCAGCRDWLHQHQRKAKRVPRRHGKGAGAVLSRASTSTRRGRKGWNSVPWSATMNSSD